MLKIHNRKTTRYGPFSFPRRQYFFTSPFPQIITRPIEELLCNLVFNIFYPLIYYKIHAAFIATTDRKVSRHFFYCGSSRTSRFFRPMFSAKPQESEKYLAKKGASCAPPVSVNSHETVIQTKVALF